MNRFFVYLSLIFSYAKTSVINSAHGLSINQTQVYVDKGLRKMHSVFVNDNEKKAFINNETDHILNAIENAENKYSDKNDNRKFDKMGEVLNMGAKNNYRKNRSKRFLNKNLETTTPVTIKSNTNTPEIEKLENIEQGVQIKEECSDILDVLVKNDDEIIDMEKQSKIYSTIIKKEYEKYGQQLLNNVFKNPDFLSFNKNENVNYNFLVNLVNIFTKYLYLNNKIEFESLKGVNIEYDCMNPQFIYLSYNKYLKDEEQDLNSIYKSCEYDSYLNRKNIMDKDLDHNGEILNPKNKLYYRFDFLNKNIKVVELSEDYFMNDKKFPLLARYKRYRSSKDGYLGYETCWFYPYYQIKDLRKFNMNLKNLFSNSYNFCSSKEIDPLNLIEKKPIGYEIDKENNTLKITKNHIQEMICSMKQKAYTKNFLKCLTELNNDDKYLKLCEKDKAERIKQENIKNDVEKGQEYDINLINADMESLNISDINYDVSEYSKKNVTKDEFSVNLNPKLLNQDEGKKIAFMEDTKIVTDDKLTKYNKRDDTNTLVETSNPYMSISKNDYDYIYDYDFEETNKINESKSFSDFENPFNSECVDKLVNECINIVLETKNK